MKKKVELREAASLYATKAKINSSNCFKTIFPFFLKNVLALVIVINISFYLPIQSCGISTINYSI